MPRTMNVGPLVTALYACAGGDNVVPAGGVVVRTFDPLCMNMCATYPPIKQRPIAVQMNILNAINLTENENPRAPIAKKINAQLKVAHGSENVMASGWRPYVVWYAFSKKSTASVAWASAWVLRCRINVTPDIILTRQKRTESRLAV